MLQLYTETSRPNYALLHAELNESMKRGVLIEPPEELVDKITNDKSFMLHKMRSQHHIDNPNSPDQIVKVLKELSFEYPKIKEACYNPVRNKWTTNANSLKQLQSENIDMLNDLMLYRSVTSITKALKTLSDNSDADGLIHPTVLSQVTNRIGYKDPGLMSIPKSILWQVVKPRTKGWHVIKVDIKNQEPWIFINQLNIEKLKLILEISGETGLYNMLYTDIYGSEPTKVQYGEMKKGWNSLTYGSSKKGLMESVFTLGQTLEQCTDNGLALYKYFNSFPEIKEYRKKMSAQAYGGVRKIKSLFGTEMQLETCPSSLAERRLMDYWIQGTAADLLTFLVENLKRWITQYHLEEHVRLYYTRHDEIDVEVSPEFIQHYTLAGTYDKLSYVFRHTINDWKPCQLEIEQVVRGGYSNSLYEQDDDNE